MQVLLPQGWDIEGGADVVFGFFRRQQEQLIDERMEQLREDIEEMLNACVGQITGKGG